MDLQLLIQLLLAHFRHAEIPKSLCSHHFVHGYSLYDLLHQCNTLVCDTDVVVKNVEEMLGYET